jgi:hypothetical protein
VESPDLSRIRRASLAASLSLGAVSVAKVAIAAPLDISPFGIPLTVESPDAIVVALAICCVYFAMRYYYYGILVRVSPMRARRLLRSGRPAHATTLTSDLMAFTKEVDGEVDRYFPNVGADHVTFTTSISGDTCSISPVQVSRTAHVLCWLETIDYLLPIIGVVGAVGLWLGGACIVG